MQNSLSALPSVWSKETSGTLGQEEMLHTSLLVQVPLEENLGSGSICCFQSEESYCWGQERERELFQYLSEMATHSNILAWRIPWTEDPGRLSSPEACKSQTWLSMHTHTHSEPSGSRACLTLLAESTAMTVHSGGGTQLEAGDLARCCPAKAEDQPWTHQTGYSLILWAPRAHLQCGIFSVRSGLPFLVSKCNSSDYHWDFCQQEAGNGFCKKVASWGLPWWSNG